MFSGSQKVSDAWNFVVVSNAEVHETADWLQLIVTSRTMLFAFRATLHSFIIKRVCPWPCSAIAKILHWETKILSFRTHWFPSLRDAQKVDGAG
jgi:hypothetical protein